MSFDNRIGLGGLLLLLAVGGVVLVTYAGATPLLVGPIVLGLLGVGLVVVGVRADARAGGPSQVAVAFHGKRLGGGLAFAALSAVLAALLFVGFDVLGIQVQFLGLGAAAIVGVMAGLIVAGTAWTHTCTACAEELTHRRFAVAPSASEALGRAMKDDDARAVAALLAGASATTHGGALGGKSGTAYADGEWCGRCTKVAFVRFGGTARWFVGADAEGIVAVVPIVAPRNVGDGE